MEHHCTEGSPAARCARSAPAPELASRDLGHLPSRPLLSTPKRAPDIDPDRAVGKACNCNLAASWWRHAGRRAHPPHMATHHPRSRRRRLCGRPHSSSKHPFCQAETRSACVTSAHATSHRQGLPGSVIRRRAAFPHGARNTLPRASDSPRLFDSNAHTVSNVLVLVDVSARLVRRRSSGCIPDALPEPHIKGLLALHMADRLSFSIRQLDHSNPSLTYIPHGQSRGGVFICS
ncbi:hypothetical protein BV25DRAFT_398846 [Artomyces pyxidatus]|uniref:Uncharacterized protein n=1 Tax=Artomyces pyxidatus TaxID=48021 RepID=A0ACB8T5T8_9AGAM|nr:hypothetical protein BV25DRAFT_398846 [Artomyces pyxidatus]